MTLQSSDVAAQAVLSHIGSGRDQAKSLSVIAEELGSGWSRRAVELAIRDLRLDGKPICSDGSGVWWGDTADLDATLHSLRSRAANQYKTMLALRRTLRRMRSAAVQQTTLGLVA